MLIKDMFTKPITRDIKGVVKVGQDEELVIKQELEEYVVTNELQRHFRDFFSSYKKGINGNTDKMGVWISGFFGSGKSHFLKILSYLLENRVVDDKHAIDYFLEDDKIQDAMVVADMKLASSVSTDTILFNIDSKSETSGKKDKNSILNVFLKVFNEKLGYSPNPHVAALERELDDSGIYDDFKEKYKEITDDSWENSRHKFNFFKDRVVKSLSEIGFMSQETASDWARSTVKPYEISIYSFSEMINDYINKKGDNHQIVFLVDEMGQYIGDNTDLMLNLQTITEDLGTLCQGRAWIVVTSQQDIDSITEVKGRDFSKIQGRFDTRLSLTSANVDEVIKLRILEKTGIANQTLSALYENKETIIKNLIIFNDGIEKKLYEDKKDFCQVYPFIPYQFNILASVLTSIRKYGASGKHLSEGERSMLALFKESAEKFKDEGHGTIVPFNIFYGALNKFLDHSHSVVIARALDNKKINPNGEENNFNVNVLKTLFMIKYVKEIRANVENITTLMVSNIDEDRIALKEKVENALEILVQQMLVQKNGDIYIFLTDEEQEINREIENQEIETAEMINKVSELIFADIFPDDKIQVSGKPRYAFGFNRLVDDTPYRTNQSFDFGVKVITPYSDLGGNEATLKMRSLEGNNVYVELPSDADFLNELRTEMKIGKFLNSSTARNIPSFEEIRAIKGLEMREHQNRAKIFLQDALKQATFYVNGDILNLLGRDFRNNLTESLERVITIVYHKLDYITHTMDENDIYSLFTTDENKKLVLDSVNISNENAIKEVLDFINLSTQKHTKISLKAIKDRFLKAPYGFLDIDIEWIIAKLFVDGNIQFTLNGKRVSRLNDTLEKIIDYITKRKFSEKVLIEEKEVIAEQKKRSLKTVSLELFGRYKTTEDSDRIILEFKQNSERLKSELVYNLSEYKNVRYPGKEVLEDGLKLINKILMLENSKEVFEYLTEKEDDYLDFADDYPQVKAFLYGEQKRIWDTTQKYILIFEDSKSYIVNEDIENIMSQMKQVIKLVNPYNQISKLPSLNSKFLEIYNDILDEQLKPVRKMIILEKERVMNLLERNQLESKFFTRFNDSFMELEDKAKNCNNVAQINGFKLEAETLRKRFTNEINTELEKIAEVNKKENKTINQVVPLKKHKNISFSDLNLDNIWKIETEADVNDYLERLKEKLNKEIKEDTIISIEF